MILFRYQHQIYNDEILIIMLNIEMYIITYCGIFIEIIQ